MGDVEVFSLSRGRSVKEDAFAYQTGEITTFQITFDDNGGEGGEVQSVEHGTVPTPPEVTREGYTFAGWSPEIAAATEDATYTAQWTALFTITIVSAHGAVIPAVGDHQVGDGEEFSSSVETPVIDELTQYVVTGWIATENLDPVEGVGTQAVVTVSGDGTLTWLWSTNYWLETAAGEHGTVDVESGWQPAGEVAQITASADLYFDFMNWTGDVTAGEMQENPLDLLMDAPKSVTALFEAIMTENRPTPLWWLAEHGITEDFEAAVLIDHDEDGIPTGDEWIMDTDPMNPDSFLRLTEFDPLFGEPCFEHIWTNEVPPFEITTQTVCSVVGHVVTWPVSTNRIYDLEFNVDFPGDTWVPVEGMTHIVPEMPWLTITNTLDADFFKLYRVRVQLPE